MMKAILAVSWFVTLSAILSAGGAAQKQDALPGAGSPYLGQRPPGVKGELFAPGIVSTPNLEHSRVSFSPDAMELFWAVVPITAGRHDSDDQNIWHVRLTDGRWPAPAKLSLPQPVTRAPALSADGTILYYLSPSSTGDREGGVPEEQVWEMRREGSGWGAPKPSALPLRCPPGSMVMSFCLAGDGDLYFDVGGPGPDGRWSWRIYLSAFKDGRYLAPVPLGDGVNEGTINQCPFVAPDESYLIFSSNREGGLGAWDLYICFRGEDGRWRRPMNLGASVNSESQERFPSVSPDGKYLFFLRPNGETRDDVFWADAALIDSLRDECTKK
jgi:hypothetical protein